MHLGEHAGFPARAHFVAHISTGGGVVPNDDDRQSRQDSTLYEVVSDYFQFGAQHCRMRLSINDASGHCLPAP